MYVNYLGEKNKKNTDCLYTFGVVYYYAGMYDKTLEYWLDELKINLDLFGENNTHTADSYNNIGIIYHSKSEYDKALEYFHKSLNIYTEKRGEMHTSVASSYNNIGAIYNVKSEYDKALEYYQKGLEIRLVLLGEKNIDVADAYNNIGIILTYKSQYDKALHYLLKSLEIKLELFGEKHLSVGASYNNIGLVYDKSLEYNKALEYYQKSLKIKLAILGEKHTDVALSYHNIGTMYNYNYQYDKALEYLNKSLKIKLELLGEKNTETAMTYDNLGNVYLNISQYEKALKYYQKGVASCLHNFNDTLNIFTVPIIKNYLDHNYLLQALQAKAKLFSISDVVKTLPATSLQDAQQIALRHYQACDTLITKVRKEITTQSDKLALGERADKIYNASVTLCLNMYEESKNAEYLKLAFEFSEKNKASVLLESLAGADALKFSGIPENLLKLEHNLSINIANFTNLKNNAQNDSLAKVWESRLFNANRSYDSLIVVFEKQYPKYYDLKYNNSTVTVEEIQKKLDGKTTFLSYLSSDSTITVFGISKTKFVAKQVEKPKDFDKTLTNLHNFLSYSSMQSARAVIPFAFKKVKFSYPETAFALYNLLFPIEIQELTTTENLIIIPDGKLAIVPFEVLHSENYTTELTDENEVQYFAQMPYLIKKYNISYSYSAGLFNNSLKNETNAKQNDWIAFAPVFDNQQIAGTTLQTKKLLTTTTNSLQTRSLIGEGGYISPLPGSKVEIENIFKLFNKKRKKAVIKTHKQADESFVKSSEMQNYRIIHFATHGFVNQENPKLSGILFAQDTTANKNSGFIPDNLAQNEGILYQSELYNCKFNADLTVLSACETGLGKITKGEGVVGLTQALLYAGSNNILVSLWQVSDASTKDLMISFYTNLLKTKTASKYGNFLRQAKLEMLAKSNYTHPYYWSPFILIGN